MVRRRLPASSCQLCKGEDSNDMVQCDRCDLWYHFGCVGVTGDIAQVEWICDKCKFAVWKYSLLKRRNKENHFRKKKQRRKPVSIQSLSSVSSKQRKILALRKLEEVKKRERDLRRKFSILEGLVDHLDNDKLPS
ncbi:Transcription initiation factor TFIID subunit 3 [Pseudolycoriella hygida]|uniref:Transcription initiation factor TFIID subunit 3 n=1 Tax=Pseudolycoriella hygida TaxID=35572 RepID=A0A9Q0S9W6_9DIPT|nr:Transcription initiation factor TFIID subunit 3 [Pseudolycoriella hygida]